MEPLWFHPCYFSHLEPDSKSLREERESKWELNEIGPNSPEFGDTTLALLPWPAPDAAGEGQQVPELP